MNTWYCLTIVWDTDEVSTIWSIDWEVIRQLRLHFRGDPEVKCLYASKEKGKCRKGNRVRCQKSNGRKKKLSGIRGKIKRKRAIKDNS